MERGMGFDWRSLGKADYAQAAALVASLPEGVRCQMDGTDKELTVRILHLSWTFSQRSGRGSAYCWPTLATLARYVRRCIRTVERHMEKLNQLGLISWKRRTTSTGGWTSNLYQIGKTFMASLFARKGEKTQQIRDTTKMSHNHLKREYKAAAPIEQAAISDWYRKNARLQPNPSLSGSDWEEAPSVDEEKNRIAERKALLRKQAEMLIARGL